MTEITHEQQVRNSQCTQVLVDAMAVLTKTDFTRLMGSGIMCRLTPITEGRLLCDEFMLAAEDLETIKPAIIASLLNSLLRRQSMLHIEAASIDDALGMVAGQVGAADKQAVREAAEAALGTLTVGQSMVRRNLLTQPGYMPYCGDADCSLGMPRADYDTDIRQFRCRCGWISEFPADFISEYTKFRIDSQICSKCGVTVGANTSKYCGDGSDKDNGHRWVRPNYNGGTIETSPTA